jgi:hypothetical protein
MVPGGQIWRLLRRAAFNVNRHCEERSDEAIQDAVACPDCRATLAMTGGADIEHAAQAPEHKMASIIIISS